MTVDRQVIPPTINHTDTDPDCDVDIVANEARPTRMRVGVSTSLAFGGNDSALVISAV
jgi:3-oxoacyl-[acyl-carrier-protein] synthase II